MSDKNIKMICATIIIVAAIIGVVYLITEIVEYATGGGGPRHWDDW
ncbi:MAG: hypothetical protein FWG66_10445 [Spirochaetes bacterium]|nr:hypothetical protein [Spirochaetota bacterium]